jgi:Flp pilus assembly protein protease CpaA
MQWLGKDAEQVVISLLTLSGLFLHRSGSNLALEEENFLQRRMEHQRIAFASFIGVDVLDVEMEDIPIIGIASR